MAAARPTKEAVDSVVSQPMLELVDQMSGIDGMAVDLTDGRIDGRAVDLTPPDTPSVSPEPQNTVYVQVRGHC